MKIKRKISIIIIVALCATIFPFQTAIAADGDNAIFSFQPLNGLPGENEVKLVVDTDNAAINHLIFDIVDPGGGNPLVFDMTGNKAIDPVIFPLHNQNVLGTETAFTTVSGDMGYDLASADPANTAVYTALHFATLITDRNLANGAGGTLTYDTDTAIYVNVQRRGLFAGPYVVLPNVAPQIINPAVNAVNLSASTVAPSAGNPIPPSLVTGVDIPATFTYSVVDTTDASVQRQMKIYKRLNDGTWGYPVSPNATRTINRSGTDMDFSWVETTALLDYATYYKVEYIATDDQGAQDLETFYFATEQDDSPPTQIAKAYMTFISESNVRADIIGQMSYTPSTDNDAVADYYLWAKDYLVAKDILNADGTRDLVLDTNSDTTVSDEEFYVGLRALVAGGHYIVTQTAVTAGATPYFRITGNDVDKIDDNGTPGVPGDDMYLVPNSLADDILYAVAADNATGLDATSSPNFSDFRIVNKNGDVFGAEVTLAVQGGNYKFITGEGSMDVWDSVYLYRNIIGLFADYPTLVPDLIHTNPYNYLNGTSNSSTTI